MIAKWQRKMKIGLFIKEELNDTEVATSIISKISEYGLEFDQENPDVVIFVGGDGTFLRAVHEYLPNIDQICFLGINQGTLGFYPDFEIEDLDDIFTSLKNDEYSVRTCSLIEALFGNQIILAVNEIRIENPFHTLIADVFVNDEYLETYRGNGLCVASTLGSSAYNKSLGGAIIASNLEVMQLTEIAPINNRIYRSMNSSIVVDENSTIILRGEFKECVIGYDHLTTKLDTNNVTFKLSNIHINIVNKTGQNIVHKLKEALIK